MADEVTGVRSTPLAGGSSGGSGGGTPDAPGPRPPRWSAGRRKLVAGGAGVALAIALAVTLLASGVGTRGGGASTASATGGDAAPGISAASAQLLSLDVLPPAPVQLAHDFHLTDQRGRPVSLSKFRGKAVVLSFNDDRCTDMCTLLAEDVIRADHYLGPKGRSQVVFLSVNANPFFVQSRDVAQWSAQHGLAGLPNWYFATAPLPTLRHIWKLYGEGVIPDTKNQSVVHSPLMDFVGPTGRLRAIAQFGIGAVDSSPFAHTMAQMAEDLLPAQGRTPVAGPQVDSRTMAGANLDQVAPSFRLPVLGSASSRLGLAAFAGRPVVVNFWSSTCPNCASELPDLASVAHTYAGRIGFVGVDTNDSSPSQALALAERAGVGYPMVSDADGAVASSYRLAGVPYTVIIGPKGRVVVRHPGPLTAEQLSYTLGSDFPALTGH